MFVKQEIDTLIISSVIVAASALFVSLLGNVILRSLFILTEPLCLSGRLFGGLVPGLSLPVWTCPARPTLACLSPHSDPKLILLGLQSRAMSVQTNCE